MEEKTAVALRCGRNFDSDMSSGRVAVGLHTRLTEGDDFGGQSYRCVCVVVHAA